jgi:hypothetical protein
MKQNGSKIFVCFQSMLNIEIWREMKMKQSENETKKKQKLPSFLLWSEMEAKFFFSNAKKVLENEMKRKKLKRSKNFEARKG